MYLIEVIYFEYNNSRMTQFYKNVFKFNYNCFCCKSFKKIKNNFEFPKINYNPHAVLTLLSFLKPGRLKFLTVII